MKQPHSRGIQALSRQPMPSTMPSCSDDAALSRRASHMSYQTPQTLSMIWPLDGPRDWRWYKVAPKGNFCPFRGKPNGPRYTRSIWFSGFRWLWLVHISGALAPAHLNPTTARDLVAEGFFDPPCILPSKARSSQDRWWHSRSGASAMLHCRDAARSRRGTTECPKSNIHLETLPGPP